VRRILKRCVVCRRRYSKPLQQKMSELPEDRVTAGNPPFTTVGVDYFGPFEVKQGRSYVKRYGCIFICLAVKAIHIEVANSMDTDSFINVFWRFICRRGLPKEIRSDNGSNFVGAEKELKNAIRQWNQTKIDEFLKQREIKWQFNPPTASHMGGIWERQIRSIRRILGVLLNQQNVEDETLSTLMCMVESMVNSRPLTVVSDDHKDPEPLTPNHLLLLRAGSTMPPGIFEERDKFRRRWRQVQYLADVFWHRWLTEYLPTLQQRSKWNKETRNVQVGDIVILVDYNSDRNSWPLGRVIETYNGHDGLVRTVKVLSKSSTFIRPIHKLCLIESVDD
jgi:hypothetical protein